MSTATYEQATGLFTINTPLPCRFVGYAGKGRGKNNPDLQTVKNIGPLPRARYTVEGPFTHPTKGPVCFRLIPELGQPMYGRGGFLIHGDSAAHPGDASEGCIVLPRPAREQIARAKVWLLTVHRLLPCVQQKAA